jgi:predicted nucleotidyltransferase
MGIHPERVMLYGSQVTHPAREGSDIDLVVISRDWTKYSRRERLEILGIASARIFEPVQAQGFTQDEITHKSIAPFWLEIMEQAVTIWASGELRPQWRVCTGG